MTTTDFPRPGSPEVVSPGSTTPEAGPDRTPETGPRPGHRIRTVLVSGAIYLVLAVLLWWQVWSTHPTSTTTCGCGDSSLFTWFLAWPAYAISHGLNPLYSTAMFHPSGVNLLANTAEVGFGVVLAPVTWLFGPVATLNVALTLSPALSALAMFVLLYRWVSWAPAAFFGGLLYGFSPFVLIASTDAHLMLSAAFVPPLVVLCLDEIVVRQRRQPVASGVVLGLLVVVQFFVGTEALVFIAIAGALGIVLVAVYARLSRPEAFRNRLRPAVTGLVAAAGTALVLLAYPLWFALDGPAPLKGSIWDNPLISYGGTNLKGYFLPEAPSAATTAQGLHYGGYQAPTLSGEYFGFGIVVVLVVGCILWRRDRRLWLFGALTLITVPLSFGLTLHGWTLWRLFVRLPLMENVIPSRFLVITYLAVAVMVGVIVDHVHADASRWQASRPAVTAGGSRGGGDKWRRTPLGLLAGTLVAVIALAPIAWYYADGLPLTATPVVLPTWFRTVAPTLKGRQVLLVFPVPYELLQSAMTWQAVNRMNYSMVGGGGPGGIPPRAGKERVGQTYIGHFSISKGRQDATPPVVTAARQALDDWGVTMVVLPDPDHLPVYEQVHQVRDTVVLMTAVTGRPPVRQAGAWVWTGVDRAGPPVQAPAAGFRECTAGPANGSVASIQKSATCVLSAQATT